MFTIKRKNLSYIKPHFILFALLFLVTQTVFADYPSQSETVINDYAAIIEPAQRDKISRLVADLKQRQSIDAVVVTINSIHDYETGDKTIESFATNLFNRWQIGSQENNDAILLLVAIKDRKVRIEVGEDYGDKLNSAMQYVIDEHILPHFRENAYSEGIYQGVFMIAKLLTASEQDAQPNTSGTKFTNNDETWWGQSLSFITELLEDFKIQLVAAFSGLVVIWRSITSYLRYRRRQCPHCRITMERLNEQADDVYLEPGQQKEETLESVDYDIWKCKHCNYHALLRYNRFFSSVETCPHCHYKTVKVKRTTLSEPTYTSTGREKINKHCNHCSYRDEQILILPQRVHSSSGSSNGSSSSGGSSSGGGASGSW